MDNLIKFREIRRSLDRTHPDRMFSFGITSHQMEDWDITYCQEMVRQGKLASFDYCLDQGKNEKGSFGKTIVFYERGISVARRKVYTFRLPFFGANIGFRHGGKVAFTWRGVKIEKIEKEKEEEKAKAILAELFKFYISFIRCWIAKDFLSYENAYPILEHYSKNDGIITIPEFMESDFKKAFDVSFLMTQTSTAISPFELIDTFGKFMVQPICINDNINIVECPYCSTKAISDGGIVKCLSCNKDFLGA